MENYKKMFTFKINSTGIPEWTNEIVQNGNVW